MKTADIILITVASFILLAVIAYSVRAEETPAEHYARYAQAIPALPGESAPLPASPSPLAVTTTGEGSPVQVYVSADQTVFAMDILRIGKSGRVPTAWAKVSEKTSETEWPWKPFVGAWYTTTAALQTAAEPILVTGEYATENQGKAAGGAIVGGLIAWEIQDNGVSDLFSSGDSSPPKPKVANPAADITIEGDNNQLRDVAQTKDVSVAGDNNVIDFQRAE